jgi:hypothetical protein
VPELSPGSVEIGPIIVTWERLTILLVSAATGVALWAFVKYSRPGKAIRATAQNPEAALRWMNEAGVLGRFINLMMDQIRVFDDMKLRNFT